MLSPTSSRSTPGDVSDNHGHVDAGRVHRFEPASPEIEQSVDDHVTIGFPGIGEVEQAPVLAHRVVHEAGIVRVRVQGVDPALRGEMGLEIDGLHVSPP